MKQRAGHFKLAGSLALAVVIAITAGCSKGGGDAAQQPSTSASAKPSVAPTQQQPVKISIMNTFYNAETPDKDSLEYKAVIEAYTNTKLEFTWVPSASYNEKLNVTLASGQMPQVIMVSNLKNPNIVSTVRSGGFWEVGPYLKDYPNLKNLNPKLLDNMAIDGKVYGVYRSIALVRNGMIFRKDWLDNLGLKVPTTIDELYNVIKAFALNDPDRNGLNDTYGIQIVKDLGDFKAMGAIFGVPNKWEVQNGAFTPAFMSKEYVEQLKFFKRLYDEKLMNQDFALITVPQRDEAFYKGKFGMFYSATERVSVREGLLKQNVPTGSLDLFSRVKGPKGEQNYAGSGFVGAFMFPKSAVKTEQELRQILAFLDKLFDKPMQNLFQYGIEGKDYKMENGKANAKDPGAFHTELLTSMRLDPGDKADPPLTFPAAETKSKEMNKKDEEIAVFDPSFPFISATFTEKGNELDQLINDASVKYIIGKLDDAGWQATLEQWKASGGTKVAEEFAQAYAKLQKK
ncbi:extracellular solute-binding protein [Paenibacillus koleovorans]|uniref:extracellular solute-binding protein n=1 Tax=Paenibacillus koleovorans TaxID=121608 RepID=UPI000FDA1F5D|nr:extracellular solute-binding protein [Paenibacillus koleovorans]